MHKTCGYKTCVNGLHFFLQRRCEGNVLAPMSRRKVQESMYIREETHVNALFNNLMNQITHPLTTSKKYKATLRVKRMPLSEMPLFNHYSTKEKIKIYKISALVRM